MPPKEKITKEQIVEEALKMTREIGFEQITTRKLAERLGCSTQPIFRAFANMEELKKEVHRASIQFFESRLKKHLVDDTPVFLGMGLAYVAMAQEEKNLFRLMTMSGSYESSSLMDFFGEGNQMYVISGLEEVQQRSKDSLLKAPHLSEEKLQELLMMTWMFTHGIASMVASHQVSYTEEELRRLIIKAYRSFASYSEDE